MCHQLTLNVSHFQLITQLVKGLKDRNMCSMDISLHLQGKLSRKIEIRGRGRLRRVGLSLEFELQTSSKHRHPVPTAHCHRMFVEFTRIISSALEALYEYSRWSKIGMQNIWDGTTSAIPFKTLPLNRILVKKKRIPGWHISLMGGADGYLKFCKWCRSGRQWTSEGYLFTFSSLPTMYVDPDTPRSTVKNTDSLRVFLQNPDVGHWPCPGKTPVRIKISITYCVTSIPWR